MISFILCNILLTVLVKTQSELLPYLNTPIGIGIGVFAIIVSLLIGYFKKAPTLIWHDAFCCATLFTWYAYWRPFFDGEAPMFYLFPVYFALMTGFVTFALINNSKNFDVDSIVNLRYMKKVTRIDINTTIVFVVVSLLIPEHYALYTMAMTFFLIQHTLHVCLENIDNPN